MKMREVERIGVTEILKKEIVFYGDWENPLFLGRDIANWIEHSDASTLLRNLEQGYEKVTNIVCTPGGKQRSLFATEDGLYEVLMNSRQPIAKELRGEIKSYLRQIRKTGGAIEKGREEEFVEMYFPSFSEEVKLSMVQDLLKTNKELKPKAEYYDSTLQPGFLKTTTDVAKDLGMSAQRLNQTLHEKELIYPKRVNGKIRGWYLYADYQHLVPEYADYHITKYNQTLKWTEKGRKYIIELISEE